MNTPNMSGNAASWRFVNDSTLKPTLMVIKSGNGFVPVQGIPSGSVMAVPVFSVNGGGGGGGGGTTTVGAVGLTGSAGNVAEVTGNSLKVFVANPLGLSGTVTVDMVGISGSDGTALDIVNSGGFKGAISLVQGIRPSGFPGIPHPVVGGAIVNTNVSGTGINGTVQPLTTDIYGNLFTSLATSLSHLVDSVSTRPVVPNTKGTYGIPLIGIGTFTNYSGIAPEVTGNVVVLSIEPDSDNTGRIYYAFSGTATTGQAWELRGERTFELNSNRELFLAQSVSGQLARFHFQTF